MANYHGSLEAVDCHIHSVRYDMVVNIDPSLILKMAGRDLLGRDGTYFHCHAAAAELTNIPIRVVGLSLGTDVFLLMISDERF